jgi:signal recognition particle subunit SEC65
MEEGVVTPHQLPVRQIVKLENPSLEEIDKYSKDTIFKIIFSEKINEEDLVNVKMVLEKYAGSVLVEDYKTERKIVKFADGELDLNIDNLIKIYAETKKVDLNKLKTGYSLIK